MITAKRDNTVKLALDAKPVNAQVHKSKYLMPNLEELMDNASQIITSAPKEEKVWFTKLDLNYAFSQLPLSELTSKHCNFNIVGGKATGTYRFKTGFYGLTDMPTEFQKAMDRTLIGLLNTFCYLDDVLVCSVGTLEEHNRLVEEALRRLLNEGFSLKLSKCEFSVNEIEWLGYKISKEGVVPIHSKIEDIVNLKTPKTLTQLRSFIGSTNQLARFIPDSQKLTAQFKQSLKVENKNRFFWSDVQQKAFEDIKEAVANVTMNHHYSTSRKTRLKCDASKLGLGATLEQEVEQDKWVPIAFASRQLNAQELKYSTSELELLAVVWSTYHFRYYLYGTRFTLLTDHKALLSAMKNNRANKTYQSKLVRWVDKLLPFDFDVSHFAGENMGFTDYLSRNASGAPEPETIYDEKFVVTSINNSFVACNSIQSLNLNPPVKKQIKRKLQCSSI